MNEHVRPRDLAPVYRSLDELSRRRWTTAELLELQERGQVAPDLEYELIDGEIVPMPSEGPLHLDLSEEFSRALVHQEYGEVRVAVERQFNITDATHVTPEIVVRPASIRMSALRGPDALLVVEIADTSLDYDTTTKAEIYAAHGVREYWVIDAQSRVTHVFRGPTPTGFTDHVELAPDVRLVPHLAPGLAIRLADFAFVA